MDTNEATSTVMSRIQRLDPDNACKIMGYILIQDPGEKEMIRLAFGPENHLISLINQAKSCLGLSSNTSSAPPPSFTIRPPNNNNIINNTNNHHPFPLSSPRIIVPNHGFHLNPNSPSSPWSSSPSFSSPRPSPSPSTALSYAAVVNGASNNNNNTSPSASPFLPYFTNEEDFGNMVPFDDEILMGLDDVEEDVNKDSNFLDIPYENRHFHRRSVSVSDMFEDGNRRRQQCMYFHNKGFCKNGNGGMDYQDEIVGSPGFDGFDELMRFKAIQHQQRLALAGGGSYPYNNRCINFLNDSPRSAAAAAALMMGEDYPTFGRCRPDRNDFAAMGFGGMSNSSARQIYLTFPADSTFKEEDVSNYFSTFGPVQDVRIPYQQKRMFGFVTFVYPETVKKILAKGNPHFVCDSRVLVKPYKEKGKILEKKHQMERDLSACLSPSGLDSAEHFDNPFGGRMVYGGQEMILRRKLEEQAELQQAIEYQGRRLMNFHLPDLAYNHPNHHRRPHLLGPFSLHSPTQIHAQFNQNVMHVPDTIDQEVLEGNNGGKYEAISSTVDADPNAPQEVNNSSSCITGNDNSNDKENNPNLEDPVLPGRSEHILPDDLVASPMKSATDQQTLAGSDTSNIVPMLAATSTVNI